VSLDEVLSPLAEQILASAKAHVFDLRVRRTERDAPGHDLRSSYAIQIYTQTAERRTTSEALAADHSFDYCAGCSGVARSLRGGGAKRGRPPSPARASTKSYSYFLVASIDRVMEYTTATRRGDSLKRNSAAPSDALAAVGWQGCWHQRPRPGNRCVV
jgi:hypothetical protein